MAKVEGTFLPPPQPRRRGRMPLEVSGYRGLIVVRQKKLPKGPKKSPLQQAWVDNFRCIAYWSKFADPYAREAAEEAVPNTGWYWRDVIESALSGKLIRFQGAPRMTTPTVYLSQSAAVNLGNGVLTTLTPDTVVWDNNYFFNPAANQERITFRTAGLYIFGALVTFATTSTARKAVAIFTNTGLNVANQSGGEGTALGGGRSCMGVYYFNADDYITVAVRASAASQTAQLNNFWAVAITPETLL